MGIEAWLVRYTWHGQPAKYVCLDKVTAEQFAVKYHGTLSPLVEPKEESPKHNGDGVRQERETSVDRA